jgi:patatin-like phospholipase
MGYRILSLDGGGAWALIQARTLIALYDANATGHEVLADFDLVAANSGGSLVLGGLVEDLKLRDLVNYFEDEIKRKSIFSRTSSWGDRALHCLTGLGPKYSAENKLPAIQALLPKRGTATLAQAPAGVHRTGFAGNVHLLIIGFDYDRNRARFFRSAPAAGPQWGQGEITNVTLAEAIHASTNTPVNYFDAPATFPDGPGRYWDGGLTGGNNPILAAVTEAIVMGQARQDIVALSLGTATVALPWPTSQDPPNSPYVQAPSQLGLVSDLRKLSTAILDDPPDIATFLAHVMTGGSAGVPAPAQSRIVRMNPLISPMGEPGHWRGPGPPNEPMTGAQFAYLARLDMDAVEQPQVDAIGAFADLWLNGTVTNQPIRMDGDTLAPELGYGSFQDAEAAWRRLIQL